MAKTKKRKSFFKILIIRISILVVLLSIIQTALLIYEEVEIQKKNNTKRTERIKEEVEAILKYTRSSLGVIEKSHAEIHYELIQNFNTAIAKQDLKKIDINQIFRKINIDSSKYNLAIIEESIIINSSNSADIGYNILEQLNDEEKALYYKVISEKEFYPTYFDLDPNTLRLKTHTYWSISDNSVIELSSFSPVVDQILVMIKNRLSEIAKADDEIVSVDFWLHTKSERFALIAGIKNNFLEDSISILVPKQKNNFNIDTLINQKRLRIEHYYNKSKISTYLLKGVSLSIITDITHQDRPIYNKIKKRILSAVIHLVLILLIIYFATRNLKVTLRDLLRKTSSIAQGVFNERVKVKGNNEFTTLSEQFNIMVDKLEFSFNDIKQKNEEIRAQMDEIEAQRDYVIEQKDIIDKQKTGILDSIDYAQQIQEATLPNEYYINEILPENFILFKPRDIVSGDFYWIRQINQYIIIVAADCTGHGVPGAFMSMLGISLLNDIIQQKKTVQPDLILNELRRQVKRSLRQTGKKGENKDGMDLALCSIDTEKNTLQFSGAHNSLIQIRDNELFEYKADRMPVGVHYREKPSFTNYDVNIKPGDTFYIFSDGFPDQLGGEKRKKFLSKNFKNLLLEINEKPLYEQQDTLEWKLKDWMLDEDQTDDIIVIGFRVI